MSLMLVMLAVSMSLAMTYSFLQTQTVAIQVGSNLQRRDLALQAAQTGISLALQDIQGASWAGVTHTLSGTLGSDSDGTTSYSVQYLPYSAPTGQVAPSDAAMRVLIQSTGTWTAAGNSGQSAQRQVQAVARLSPRIPGRGAVAGDLAAAEDVASNPGDYDSIRSYTVFANQSGTTLSLDPADRIEGPLWIYDSINLFNSPSWSNSTRSAFLASVKSRFVTTSQGKTQYWYPHPLSGPITFYKTPSGSLGTDLSTLGTSWSQPQVLLNKPSVTPSNWQQYQLYSGGFVYNAVAVSSQLQSVTLRPTATNPAGIFYSSGSVTLGDDTVIQGTLVANGQVTFSGDRVFVGAYNWLDSNGQPIETGSNTWPRLPAVVAQSVTFTTDTQTMIEGPVIAANAVSGAGGTYEYLSLGGFALTGTATCQPTQQPWSTVQLAGLPSLIGLTGSGNYSIWLTQGTTGNW
ncbi:MAG TPA: hypothetical protein VHB77_03255, partial [Planctomycetaceae bacterium]|nr:hypothetical protein [Planctomycetaceae bacterium]